MRYFSMFSGIGVLFTKLKYAILAIWTERNISVSISESGKPKTESECWLWSEKDTTLKHQNRREPRLPRTKSIVRKLELILCNIMVVSVPVVMRRTLSFSASTTSTITELNTEKIW